MSQITWHESQPSATSLMRKAPPFFHSVWTAISVGVANGADGMYWDGSGGASYASAGDLKAGSGRCYSVTTNYLSSALSGTLQIGVWDNTGGVTGAPFLALHEQGGTYLMGSSQFVELAAEGPNSITTGNAGQDTWVVTKWGSLTTTDAGQSQLAVDFGCTFGAPPIVMVESSNSVTAYPYSITDSACSVFLQKEADAPSVATVYWFSLGTIGGIDA